MRVTPIALEAKNASDLSKLVTVRLLSVELCPLEHFREGMTYNFGSGSLQLTVHIRKCTKWCALSESALNKRIPTLYFSSIFLAHASQPQP